MWGDCTEDSVGDAHTYTHFIERFIQKYFEAGKPGTARRCGRAMGTKSDPGVRCGVEHGIDARACNQYLCTCEHTWVQARK